MGSEAFEFWTKPHILYPCLFFAMIIASSIVKGMVACVTGVARERTRREIAAYIAEGSMSPEQGEKLMKAGQKSSCC